MDLSKIKITETRRILKYNEGNMETPYEVVEKEHVVEGAEAIQMLRNMGILKEDEQNAIN